MHAIYRIYLSSESARLRYHFYMASSKYRLICHLKVVRSRLIGRESYFCDTPRTANPAALKTFAVLKSRKLSQYWSKITVEIWKVRDAPAWPTIEQCVRRHILQKKTVLRSVHQIESRAKSDERSTYPEA